MTWVRSIPLLWNKRSCDKIFGNSMKRCYAKISPITVEKGLDQDVEFHSNLASQWWDKNNPLQRFNEVRVPFIHNGCANAGLIRSIDYDPRYLLQGLEILDVGCGGGTLSERLARLHGHVVGIDPSETLIEVAKNHSAKDKNFEKFLRYERAEIHEYSQKHAEEFDVVVLSEVLEHVTNKERLLYDCIKCIKPKGSLFITTPNKTIWSKWLLINLAERLRIIPLGTHDFRKFITPEELSQLLIKLGCSVRTIEGFNYYPLTGRFTQANHTLFMYGLHAQKDF